MCERVLVSLSVFFTIEAFHRGDEERVTSVPTSDGGLVGFVFLERD